MGKELDRDLNNTDEGKWVSVGPDSRYHTETGVLDLKIPGQARKIIRLAAERQLSSGSLSTSKKNALIDYCVYLVNIYATREAFPQNMLGVGDFDYILDMQEEVEYLKEHHGQDLEDDALYGAKALIALGLTVDEAVKKIEHKHRRYVIALMTGELSDEQEDEVDARFKEVVRGLYLKGTPGDEDMDRKPRKIQPGSRVVDRLDNKKRKEIPKPEPKTEDSDPDAMSASQELMLPDW